MSATPNLAIEHILTSQAQKEVTANEAFDALDQAIAGLLEVDVSAGGTITIDPTAALTCKMLRLTGALLADAAVVVPDNRKPYFIQNSTTGGFAVTVKTAAGAGVEVPSTGGSNTANAYCDGTSLIEMSSGAPAEDQETETVYHDVTVANPGAESGSIANWTSEAGSWSSRTSVGSMGAAHSGSRFFYNESSADGVLTQTIDLAVDGFSGSELDTNAVFRLDAWAGAANSSDTGIVEIDWLDAADQVLDSASTGEVGPSSRLGTWDQVELTGLVPIGSRKAKIRLRTKNHFGSNSTYCFDDIALQIGLQEAAAPGLGAGRTAGRDHRRSRVGTRSEPGHPALRRDTRSGPACRSGGQRWRR